MSRKVLGRVVAVILATLSPLVVACGGPKEDPPPQPAGFGGAPSPGSDLPRITVEALHGPMYDLRDRLLMSREPTAALVAGLPGGRDADTSLLIDLLRKEVLYRENEPWTDHPTDVYFADRRCCSAEALSSQVGLQVEVYRLGLSRELALVHASDDTFAPLRTPKVDCLRDAKERGRFLGAYGPILLRDGETARLAAGWTRARLSVRQRPSLQEDCFDTFVGMRVAVTALSSGRESDPWALGVFMSSMELKGEEVASEGGWVSQEDQTGGSRLRTPAGGLGVSREERCWLQRFLPEWRQPATQILVCARVVDLK